MNGTPMNGRPINGSWVAPSSAPYDASGAPAAGMRAIADHPSNGQSEVSVPSPAADPWPDLPLDDLEQQRPRLEGEIAAAKARTAAARERAAARDAEVRAALRAELVASKESVAEIERDCDITIANIRKAAQIEVERILAEAWQLTTHQPGIPATPEQRGVKHVE
jgi:hypothetical protein